MSSFDSRRAFLALALAACAALPSYSQAAPAQRLRLATTTSTEQSGLLGVLLPAFEKKHGYTVDVVAVGTGAALKLGQNGDADVVLVHARAQEDAFMAAGWGDERRDVFYNDFVVLGPVSDPARLASAAGSADAFARIAAAKASFVSRGDKSGTHVKELDIWKSAATAPGGSWYKEAGQGMSQVILMADQLGAYTLSDRATWLAMKDKTKLAVVYQGEKGLFNPYGVISVSAAKHPGTNAKGAKALVEWMSGPEARALVEGFKIGGEACFFTYR